MSRHITILGLGASKADVCVRDGVFEEVWTLNDWFNPHFYPELRHPDRVYQIHHNYVGRNEDYSWRCYPNWKDKYNESKAKIIVTQLYEGLENQQLFDIEKAVKEWGNWRLQSTIDYMLFDAIDEGVEEVTMHGVHLKGEGEWSFQMPTVAYNIADLRKYGIKVHNKYESQWNVRTVDWAKLKDIDVRYGSIKDDKTTRKMIEAEKFIAQNNISFKEFKQ